MAKRKYTTASIALRVLPKEERWDCHGCGHCCRGTIIALDSDDLAQLEQQQWDKHADMAGVCVVRRSSLLGNHFELARRDDGSCVFFTSDGRCRIHEEFGEDAKPRICRMFPLQPVRLDRNAWLTVRRSCPSAALGQGRAIKDHLADFRRQLDRRGIVLGPAAPPPVSTRYRGDWDIVHRVADSLERLVSDTQYSLARRLVHGLYFCRNLDQCRLRSFNARALSQLPAAIESAAPGDARELSGDREPPTRSARGIFHQTVFEHLRLHPRYVIRPSLAEKWRLLRAGYRFARGRGELPFVHADLPRATFDSFDRPLGRLAEEIMRPITEYFETAVLSRRFMMLGRSRWPITDSFRALALSHAIVLWLGRLTSNGREPTVDDAVEAIIAVDRAQGFAPLCGRRHRQRVAGLEYLDQLEVLVSWYDR
ncbi:MAG: YkgJ family cysteine cluster protein [Pirellulaceae bacterium]|nr:YkgJ family cysteine cluster protein [Pirellulaceae bacterium]